jgi:hypothetical protein
MRSRVDVVSNQPEVSAKDGAIELLGVYRA